jgi:hypothetical protein
MKTGTIHTIDHLKWGDYSRLRLRLKTENGKPGKKDGPPWAACQGRSFELNFSLTIAGKYVLLRGRRFQPILMIQERSLTDETGKVFDAGRFRDGNVRLSGQGEAVQ